MMNVASNLRTLSLDLLYDASEVNSINQDHIQDPNFKRENEIRFEDERKSKNLIFEMYKEVFDHNPDLFHKHREYNLQPLSNLMAEIFSDLTPQDALMCL